MFEFKLADVGEGIHEVEIMNWLVKPGDTVTQDQIVLEIQTDKAVVEIPTPVAGTVVDIKAQTGELAHVGDVLVVLQPAGGTPPPVASDVPATLAANQQTPPGFIPLDVNASGIKGPGKRILAAPAVRKLALQKGVNLADVAGSGNAGRVLLSDLKAFLTAPTPTPPPATPVAPAPIATAAPVSPQPLPPAPPEPPEPPVTLTPVNRPLLNGSESTIEKPLQGLRRRIAERMEEAWRIPHVTTFDRVDAFHLVALRRELKPSALDAGIRLTYLPFIIKAVLAALRKHPVFNASLDIEKRKVLYHQHYHLGIATAIDDGLIVPVLRHADQLTILETAQELARLAEWGRARKLGPEELSGSTFTLTNFGSFGSWLGTPIINPPEVAILGVGRIEEEAVVVDGQVVARPVLPLAISYDHRLIDGALAGAFLSDLKAMLANPNQLLLALR